MPYPKIRSGLEVSRVAGTLLKTLKRFRIEPDDALIRAEASACEAEALLFNGPMENHVDLLFVAEGYQAHELDKFKEDALLFSEYLFEYEPFTSRKTDFNIWILPLESKTSGPSLPQHGLWTQTSLNSTFHTFYLERSTPARFAPLAKAVSGLL